MRDDLVMGDCQRDVFELLVRRGDVESIRSRWVSVWGWRWRLVGEVWVSRWVGSWGGWWGSFAGAAQAMEELDGPLIALKDYLKDIQ